MRLRSSLLVSSVVLTAACGQGRSPSARETLKSTTEEIVGGIVDPGHGYVVGIGDGTPGSNGAFCTGTVVSRRTVLTAGHCFDGTMGANGGIGAVEFGTNLDASQLVKVTKATLHPKFNDNTLANDLTVIELAADSPIQPAPLLRETMENSPIWIGPNFTFVGYGDINGTGQGFGMRRVVLFPLVAIGPKKVGGTANNIDATQVYYATKGKNTCSGDSGGPTFAVRNGVERHAGTTSFGDGPCKLDGVDARTDLPAIMGFIQAQIDANEGTDPCRNDGVCDETCNTGPDLVDPDCAENHCGKDGICALSCVAPVDPDCQTQNSIDHCGADGVCDPTCPAADSDCASGVGGAGGAGGGSGGGGGTSGAAGAGGGTGGSGTAGAGGTAGNAGATTVGAGGASAGAGGEASVGGAGGSAQAGSSGSSGQPAAGAGGLAGGGNAGTGAGGSAHAGTTGSAGHAGTGQAGTGAGVGPGAGGAAASVGGADRGGSGGGTNPDVATDGSSSEGGGCSTSGSRGRESAVWGLLLGASLLVRRRRGH